MFKENQFSKFTEVIFYFLLPFILYFHMRDVKVTLWGSPILLLGAIFYLAAKISVIRKGIYFSFGCENMTKRMMWFYFAGYILIIAGYVVTFSVIEFK